MEIIEMARRLGQLIKDSDEMMRMNIAEEKYDADAELQSLINEYKAHDTALASTDDVMFNEVIEKRKNEIYDVVVANAVYKEYISAQEDVNRLMNKVNSEISFIVTGRRECGEDGCSGCSGCHNDG